MESSSPIYKHNSFPEDGQDPRDLVPMRNPLIHIHCGRSAEDESIKECLQLNGKCISCNQNARIEEFVPNRNLQGVIEAFPNKILERVQRLEQIVEKQKEEISDKNQKTINLAKAIIKKDKENEAKRLKKSGIQPKPKKELVSFESAAHIGKILLKGGTTKLATKKLGGKFLLAGAGKYITKTSGAKIILESAALNSKFATKFMGKSGSEMVGKKIPVLSFFLGCCFGIKRFWDGEVIKGVGEIASGTMACVPGYGTWAAVAIDLTMAADDIRLSYKEQKHIEKEVTKESYEKLGFDDVDFDNPPTKEEIDSRCRHLFLQFHPDKLADFEEEEYTIEQLKDMNNVVTTAKEWIYQIRGWR